MRFHTVVRTVGELREAIEGVDPHALIVWCHRCRDLAEVAARRRRRAQLADELGDSQLGLWGAA